MSEALKIRRALISVYDKTGIVEFAKALHQEFGIELVSTGGTARTLKDAGLPVTLVEEITGFPEMMDGRVKTLHPKIHAAILADRDNPEHMRQLKEQGIEPIDMVVVNLYPFEETIAKPDCTFEEAIEMIDIGGPCLLRAAAKNHKHVLPLVRSHDFQEILVALRTGELTDARHSDFAARVFSLTRLYDLVVLNYLLGHKWNSTDALAAEELGPLKALVLARSVATRYGENPHQSGGLYLDEFEAVVRGAERMPLPNQPMSFNNYADASAALELCAELTRTGRTERSFVLPSGQLYNSAQPDNATATPSGRAKLRFAPIDDETTTRRHLPHWQIPGATYWVTFTSKIGTLTEAERDIALNAVRFWDGKRMDLHAAVVMPNHVHVLFTPRETPEQTGAYYNLSELLRSIKGYSGAEISRGRGVVGQVWVHESFDRWIRSADDFEEKWQYITQNPVKEGLAPTPDAYRWWYAVDVLGLGIGMAVTEETPRPRVLVEGGWAAGPNADNTAPRKTEPCRPLMGGDPAHAGEAGKGGKAELCPPPPSVCFIKHTNACGSAVDADPLEAYRKAYLGDPNAAMGGILAVNFDVDAGFAEAVMETYQHWGKAAGAGGFFVEVWLAPSFDEDAVRIIRGEVEGKPQKAWGKRVRLLDVGDLSVEPDPGEMDLKRIAGGVLMQNRDLVGLNEDQWKVVTKRQPTDAELDDLRLAWLVCKHTKSNAITICKDGMLIGNGAGQMSRVMSCRIATWLGQENKHDLKGSVAASDAFFPFRDGPDILADAGVTALIQPGGSKRDEDTIAACNERGLAMIFTGTRHFRH